MNNQTDINSISGEDYDYTKTMRPERPYIHDYSQTMTMKMDIAYKAGIGETRLVCSFAEALEKIKAIDKITLGAPKIVYLVGFQYFGHDSGYPAFFEVNEAAAEEGKTGRESLIRLMDEAFKYNTTVSFHLNISDAYEHSELWDEYIKNDLICTDADGRPTKGGVWDGDQCYHVCYDHEWNSGHFKKRIDRLLECFPVQRAGTVHFDAMHNPCLSNGCKCGGYEKSITARRKMLRYLRDCGVDVTSEHVYSDPPTVDGEELFIGLQPMAWLFSQTLEDYIRRPASLLCGGNCTQYFKGQNTIKYKTLFGENLGGEDFFGCEDYKKRFVKGFCTVFLPFSYLNSLQRQSAEVKNDGNIIAHFSDGVSSQLFDELIWKNNAVLRKNGDICMPAVWKKEKNAVVYSENGGEKQWNIGELISGAHSVRIYGLDENGLSKEYRTLNTESGIITLRHTPESAFYCVSGDL